MAAAECQLKGMENAHVLRATQLPAMDPVRPKSAGQSRLSFESLEPFDKLRVSDP